MKLFFKKCLILHFKTDKSINFEIELRLFLKSCLIKFISEFIFKSQTATFVNEFFLQLSKKVDRRREYLFSLRSKAGVFNTTTYNIREVIKDTLETNYNEVTKKKIIFQKCEWKVFFL